MIIEDNAVLVTGAMTHSAESVTRAIFDGLEKGAEDIVPDPMSASMAESCHDGATKAFERQNASLMAAEPVASQATGVSTRPSTAVRLCGRCGRGRTRPGRHRRSLQQHLPALADHSG